MSSSRLRTRPFAPRTTDRGTARLAVFDSRGARRDNHDAINHRSIDRSRRDALDPRADVALNSFPRLPPRRAMLSSRSIEIFLRDEGNVSRRTPADPLAFPRRPREMRRSVSSRTSFRRPDSWKTSHYRIVVLLLGTGIVSLSRICYDRRRMAKLRLQIAD